MNENVCGIYYIKNLVNGKYYVGQSINIKDRWYKEKYQLQHNNAWNLHLQKAWNKYGESNFEWCIIEECEVNKEILNAREIYWISEYDAYYHGYNYDKGGNSGMIPNENTRKKMSESHKGKTHSDETKKKMSEAQSGEKHAFYGKKHKQETKVKMSETRRQKIENHIYCIELNEFFGSSIDVEEKYGIRRQNVIACCRGNQISAGRHPQTNEKLHWRYVTEEEIDHYMSNEHVV